MRLQAKKENRPKWKCSLKLILGAFLTFLMLVYALVLHAMVNNRDHSNEVSALVSEIKNLHNDSVSVLPLLHLT